jgi:hypothetical protein
MEQAAIAYVLAVRLLHVSSIIMTHAVEDAFSKVKRVLRKVESRAREALVEAIGVAISAVTAKDARGFFEHCGYGMLVQSL